MSVTLTSGRPRVHHRSGQSPTRPIRAPTRAARFPRRAAATYPL